MIDLFERNRDDLLRLCAKHHVRRLELFGSAAAGDFDPESSDLDFLVAFSELTPSEHARAYFGLLEALEALFQRPVDLLEAGAIHNPYLQASVDRTRVLLYAA